MPTTLTCDCDCHAGGAFRPACSIHGGCGSVGCDGRGHLTDQPDPDREEIPTCVSCGRKRPVPAGVCRKCRTDGVTRAHRLPTLYRELELELIPRLQLGERVTSSSPHSSPSARLDALQLRHSSADQLAASAARRRTTCNSDGAPVDLSIPAFADYWARQWRSRLGHHRPAVAPARRPEWPPRQPPLRPRPPLVRINQNDPEIELTGDDIAAAQRSIDDRLAWMRERDAWMAVHNARVAEMARVNLALGAALPVPDRPDDPVLEAWDRRMTGYAPRLFSLGRDVAYLETWLDHAADAFDDTDRFLTDLRRLISGADTALGHHVNAAYLGRCPETRWDRDAREDVLCGAKLWCDPYMDQSACPRCGTVTEKEARLWLARRIREAFPADALPRPWEPAR